MLIEELYDLVSGLKIEEVGQEALAEIVATAAVSYLRNRDSETLEFCLDNWFIEQNPVLDVLGITVSPCENEFTRTSYGSDPFGPSDRVTIDESDIKTLVEFPTSLFHPETKCSEVQKKLEKVIK